MILKDDSSRLQHDLRGPLNAIIGFAELLHDGKTGPVSPIQREFLGDILESARRLSENIDGLFRPGGAALLPPQAAAPSSHTAAPSPAVPRPETGPDAATVLVVEDDAKDRSQITEILTHAGYVVETAATGLDALERCRQRRFAGITLDLLLPDMSGWDVVRALGEENLAPEVPIVVVSAVPQKVAAGGIVLREALTKPIQAADLLDALHRAGVPPRGPRPILIVDNNASAAKVAAGILRAHGYTSEWHGGAEEALAAAAEKPPAAVLLDLLMPGMDGFEFLERLRAAPAGANVPVIVWTVQDLTPEDRQRLGNSQAIVQKRAGGTRRLIEAVETHVPIDGATS